MIEEERLKQLEQSIPDVWANKKVLYIGANKDRFHFSKRMREKRLIVDVLEIDEKNCEYLKTLNWLNNVICGDVKNVKRLCGFYDTVLWSHGPETIEKKHLGQTIKDISDIASLCVFMCPWGISSSTDNITTLYENDFIDFGFKTSVIGGKDKDGSNLLAWRRR